MEPFDDSETRLVVEHLLRLTLEFVDAQYEAAEFIERFGDLFHVYALDGHEGSSGAQDLDQFPVSITILGAVQGLIGMIVTPRHDIERYIAVGRIPLPELRDRIKNLLGKLDLVAARNECVEPTPVRT